MQIQLPEKVQYIIQALEGAGFEAYAVGGCVRDSLLGRVPDDWDITTSARPLAVKADRYRNPAWNRNGYAWQGRLRGDDLSN